MKPITRIEQSLATAIASGEAEGCPPKLAGAIRHAVFPGGARIRPQLCLAVAQACGDDDPMLSDAAATAIELLHCASLVHDDLPCFDDASTRRGRASVHFAFGESLAVLAGECSAEERHQLRLLKGEVWVVRPTGSTLEIIDHIHQEPRR